VEGNQGTESKDMVVSSENGLKERYTSTRRLQNKHTKKKKKERL
jgi:hypothetical protein